MPLAKYLAFLPQFWENLLLRTFWVKPLAHLVLHDRNRYRAAVLVAAFGVSVLLGGILHVFTVSGRDDFTKLEDAQFQSLLASEPAPAYFEGPPLLMEDIDTVVGPRLSADLDWPHSVALGRPDRGSLQHPERLHADSAFTVRPRQNYGTVELISALRRAGQAVQALHDDSPKLHVGDISLPDGGPFPPHWSHQSGCDVDIGYYLSKRHEEHRFKVATRRSLDAARTWTLLESILINENTTYVFSDENLIPLLYREARSRELYTKTELARWFGKYSREGRGQGIIRHLRGHADHLHIRVKPNASAEAVSNFEHRHGTHTVAALLDRRPVLADVGLKDNWRTLATRYGVSEKRLRKMNRAPEDFILQEAGNRIIVGFRSPKHNYRSANPRLTGKRAVEGI